MVSGEIIWKDMVYVGHGSRLRKVNEFIFNSIYSSDDKLNWIE